MSSVLTWVNDKRERRNLPPLISLPPGDGRRSPVEVALGCKVTLGRLQLNENDRITFIEIPRLIERHIEQYRSQKENQ